MAEQILPHCLTLNERKKLTLTGATEVTSFDDTSVVVGTPLGTLVVQGRELQLRNLTEEGGNVAVQGYITGITYEEPRPEGGWLSRLFR